MNLTETIHQHTWGHFYHPSVPLNAGRELKEKLSEELKAKVTDPVAETLGRFASLKEEVERDPDKFGRTLVCALASGVGCKVFHEEYPLPVADALERVSRRNGICGNLRGVGATPEEGFSFYPILGPEEADAARRLSRTVPDDPANARDFLARHGADLPGVSREHVQNCAQALREAPSIPLLDLSGGIGACAAVTLIAHNTGGPDDIQAWVKENPRAIDVAAYTI